MIQKNYLLGHSDIYGLHPQFLRTLRATKVKGGVAHQGEFGPHPRAGLLPGGRVVRGMEFSVLLTPHLLVQDGAGD